MTVYHLRHALQRDRQDLGSTLLWLLLRGLPAMLLAGLALLLLLAAPARAMEEPGAGYIALSGEGGYRGEALLQASEAHLAISGMVAQVRVQQRFHNSSEQWVEGVYAFPLPEGAAVRHMEMRIGERRILGEIREREEARQVYRAARESGRKASLVEQQRPNLFTNRVANIGPGEEIIVLLEYVQAVDYQSGRFSLSFPMTITPRYLPGQPLPADTIEESVTIDPYLGWGTATDQVPDGAAVTPLQHATPGSDLAPLNPITLTARLDMGMPLAEVQSPYHEIALSRTGGVYDIKLARGVSEMDRDFVLSWEPVAGSEPSAALFTEEVAGEYFGLLLLLPPAMERAGPPPAREIIFVVDTSGSMGGVSIRQARESVSHALRQLRPEDRFNVIEFNSSHRRLYRQSMPASRHHVQQAMEFVRQLDASGGTEMLPALQAALAPSLVEDMHREQVPLRQVVFITDGAVGNEVALFEEIDQRLGATRLFTVGIGSAPNSWFMRKAAEFGRGTHTHIADLGEVGEKMDSLFNRLSQPAAVDLAVSWPSPVESWPRRQPDLYLGQPLMLAVKFGTAPPAGDITVRGRLEGRPWEKTLQLDGAGDPAHRAQHPGVASLWARRKITGLLDEKITGRSEDSVRAEVLPLALAHRLLSPYTSFVAVEEVISRSPKSGVYSHAVPNSRPRGQSDQSYAYPRTATTGPAQAWFGSLLLGIALLWRVMTRPELDHRGNVRA